MRSRKNSVQRRQGKVLAAVAACAWVAGLAGAAETANYTGPNNGWWNAPANWSGGAVPANSGATTYLVSIPDSRTMGFDRPADTAIDALTLGGYNSRLNLTSGYALTVLGNVVSNGGVVDAQAGAFTAATTANATSYTGSFFASAGGVATLGFTAYRSDWQDYRGNRTALSANGAGSLVDLSDVLTFNGAGWGWGGSWTYTVQALNGGTIDLSATTALTGARTDVGDNNDRLYLLMQSGGTIRLDALRQISGRTTIDVQVASLALPNLDTAANTTLSIATGSVLSAPKLASMLGSGSGIVLGAAVTQQLPVLTQFSGGPITLGNASQLSVPALVTIDAASISAGGGATLNAPALVSLTDSDVTFDGTWTANLGPVAVADYSRIRVSNGGALSLPSLTAYRCDWQDYRAGRTALSADGAGSVLDLSHVTILNGAAYGHGGSWIYTLQATSGGTLDLSAVIEIAGSRTDNDDWLKLSAQSGGTIRLNSLRRVTGRTILDVQSGSMSLPALESLANTTISIGSAAAFSAPKLNSMTDAGSGISLGAGASFSAPLLATINAAAISASAGSTLSVPALVNLTDSDLRRDGTWTLNLGPIASVDYSRIAVSAGDTLALPGVASYRCDWGDYRANRIALSADGTGSLLDLSHLTSINGAAYGHGGSWTYTLQAINAGTLDLSGVTSIAGSRTDNDDWLKLSAQSGGTLRLNSLRQIAGRTLLDVGVPSMTLPQLQSVVNTQLTIAAGSALSAPALLSMSGDGSAITVGGGGQLGASLLASIDSAAISVSAGGTLNLPSLRVLTNSDLRLDPGWTLTAGPIDNIALSRLAVASGASLALPGVTAYRCDWGDYRASRTALSADGTGSLLDLSHVTSLNGAAYGHGGSWTYTLQAANSGTLDLSGVTDIAGSRTDNDDWLKLSAMGGGVLKLDNLQRITGRTLLEAQAATLSLPGLQSAANTTLSVASGAVVSAPKLNSMTGAGTAINLGASVSQSLPMLATFSDGPITLGNGATLSAPALVTINGSSITASGGATLSVPALVNLTDSDLRRDGTWTLTLGPVASVDYSRIAVSGGDTLALPNVTAYRCDWGDYRANRTALGADGAGSVLSLPNVASLNGAGWGWGGAWTYLIQASNGARVELPKLATVIGARSDTGDNNDWLKFSAQTGGTIDLSGLRQASGRTIFEVGTNGHLLVRDLVIKDTAEVRVLDVSSEFAARSLFLTSTSALTAATGATLRVTDSFLFAQTDENRVKLDQAIVWMAGAGLQNLEVGGTDLGIGGAASGNFGIGQLIIGQEDVATTVHLLDMLDNGNRAPGKREALYLFGIGGGDGLVLNDGSTLILDGLNVYTKQSGGWVHLQGLFTGGATQVNFGGGTVVVPEPAGLLALLGAGLLALRRRRR